MLNRTIIILSCLTGILLAGCPGKQKFDAGKWDDGDGLTFAYRPRIIDDLAANYKLRGLKYQQVIHLLHRPQLSSKDSMYYEVEEQYNNGKLIYAKSFVLYLKDSVVISVAIHEKGSKK